MISTPSKHFSRMKRAREMCGRNVTTMTVLHPYWFARRRSSRASPLVVPGSGTKHSSFGCGVAQKSVIFVLSGPLRNHDSRCPSLGLKIQAHGVAVLAVSAQDEDRVGMMQVIDLRSHVNRERGDDGRGQQHASAYCYSSEAPQAPGSRRRRCSAGLEFVPSACGIGAPGVGSVNDTPISLP